MDAPGKQWVAGEVDSGNDVRGTKGDLLGFGEEVVRIAVEDEPTHGDDRHHLLRHELGRIKHIEGKLLGVFLAEQLQAKFVLGIVTGLDRIP
jgi:hypothetical protein